MREKDSEMCEIGIRRSIASAERVCTATWSRWAETAAERYSLEFSLLRHRSPFYMLFRYIDDFVDLFSANMSQEFCNCSN